MLRLLTDFNARTTDGKCWILLDGDEPVEDIVLKEVNRTILYEYGEDFEVEAVISFEFVKDFGRNMWVAIPDWTAKRDITLPGN